MRIHTHACTIFKGTPSRTRGHLLSIVPNELLHEYSLLLARLLALSLSPTLSLRHSSVGSRDILGRFCICDFPLREHAARAAKKSMNSLVKLQEEQALERRQLTGVFARN